MKSNIIITGLIFTLMLIVTSCGMKSDPGATLEKLKKQRDDLNIKIKDLESKLKPADSASAKNTKDIMVTPVQFTEFNHYLEIQGKVDGEDNIGIAPQMAATVTRVYVKEGDQVHKGQVLAQLDDNVLLQQIAAVNQQLDYANTVYMKQKSLWDQKIGSEVQFLGTKNQKESLEKNISTLNQQLELYKIKSPINGSVEEVNVKIGQMASPGATPAFRVVNFSTVKVLADIAEVYGAKIKPGNQVLVFFPDFNTEIKSSVRFTSRYINPTNRTFQAEIRLGPSKVQYRANMLAVVRINDYHNTKAITYPINIIKSSQSGNYLFVVREENGKTVARKQVVTTGQVYNGIVEITDGLKVGDSVITTGYNSLLDGQLVQVK